MQPSCVAFKSMCKKVEDNSQEMAAIANEFHKFICINIVSYFLVATFDFTTFF